MALKVHLLLVAGLLVAASISNVAEAGLEDATLESRAPIESLRKAESGCFWVELILRNMAQGSVTIQLESNVGSERIEMAAEEVVAQTGQWTAMGPVEVRLEHPVVQLGVTVTVGTHERSAPVKKVLQINLLQYFGDGVEEEGGRRAVVLTAVESWRLKSGKYLVIQMGAQRKVVLSFTL